MAKKGKKAALAKDAKAKAKATPGKKPNKKSWRKADISDVEDALEDERLVDRIKKETMKGKKILNKGDELFTVDTKGSSEGVSRADRREAARAKLFPAKVRLGMSAAEEGKLARAEERLERQKPQPKRNNSAFDLWDSGPDRKEEPEFPLLRVDAMKTMRPQSVPKHMHSKPSNIPAVLPAHEGQSMNPVDAAYEDVVCKAAAQQIGHEHKAEVAERKMQPITKELSDLLGEVKVEQMSEEEKMQAYKEHFCQTSSKEEDKCDENAEGGIDAQQSRAVKIKEKSLSKRKKTARSKDLEGLRKQEHDRRKLEKSVGELGVIKKQLKEEEEQLQARREYRETMRAKRKQNEMEDGTVPHHRRLGKHKFRERAIIVPDAEGLHKGLRAMPLQQCAIHERLSSIVRRGMMPAPPQMNKEQVAKKRQERNRIKRSRKFISPLMRSWDKP